MGRICRRSIRSPAEARVHQVAASEDLEPFDGYFPGLHRPVQARETADCREVPRIKGSETLYTGTPAEVRPSGGVTTTLGSNRWDRCPPKRSHTGQRPSPPRKAERGRKSHTPLCRFSRNATNCRDAARRG